MNLEINVNDPVEVKLTKEGLAVLKQHLENIEIRYPPPWLEGNTLRTQLWDLMQTFGHQMYMGNLSMMFEENQIRVSVGAD